MVVIKGNSNYYHMIKKVAYRLHIFSLISSPFVMNISLTFYIIETPLNSFGNRADPDQAALLRAEKCKMYFSRPRAGYRPQFPPGGISYTMISRYYII